MDAALRHTPGLTARIDKLRDDLIKRFENLIGLAALDKIDRNSTALSEYQVQVETAALVRAAEDMSALIRQLQEMWLMGQLNTIGDSKVQQQTDENAKVVAGLLKQLTDKQSQSTAESRL